MSTSGTVYAFQSLTFGEDGNVPTLGKDARGEDTKDQEDCTCGGPPANKITDKIDLLVAVALSPETDTLLAKRPRAG